MPVDAKQKVRRYGEHDVNVRRLSSQAPTHTESPPPIVKPLSQSILPPLLSQPQSGEVGTEQWVLQCCTTIFPFCPSFHQGSPSRIPQTWPLYSFSRLQKVPGPTKSASLCRVVILLNLELLGAAEKVGEPRQYIDSGAKAEPPQPAVTNPGQARS